LADDGGQVGAVAGGVADAGGFVIFCLGKVGPDEAMADGEGEGAEELALGAAVAFAEWVDGVDLAEVVGGAEGEGVGVEMLELVFGADVGEDGFERWEDIDRWWEAEGVGTCCGHFTELAGPGKYILKDVLVDASKMLNVEVAG